MLVLSLSLLSLSLVACGSRDRSRPSGSEDGGLVMTLDGAVDDDGSIVGVRDGGVTSCPPGPGRLAIVEVMIASQAGSDRGEWFELQNTATCAVALSGLVIESPTSSGPVPVTHTMTGGVIAPGGHFVLALSGDSVDNHELPYDYVYGTGATSTDVLFNNTGDELAISYGGVELDRVVWPNEGFTRSYSRQFPRTLPVSGNGNWASWCDATAIFSTIAGTSYYGSPGAANGVCP